MLKDYRIFSYTIQDHTSIQRESLYVYSATLTVLTSKCQGGFALRRSKKASAPLVSVAAQMIPYIFAGFIPSKKLMKQETT